MDVKSAILYGTIKEEVYVCQPPGFENPQFPDKVYKVEKALYGLHQKLLEPDKGDILLVQVYVDDIIFGSTKKSLYVEFKSLMHKKFQMSSMGELTFFLWLQVMQRDDGIFISQDKYVADILKKFDFVTMKTTSTPIETNKALLKDEEVEDVDVHLYRSMIGSLMYLTTSRPDIMFAVCACARFQVTPKVSGLHAVKRIFRYLKGQPKLGLWYPRDSSFDLEAFFDSDYVGASLDRKFTIGAEYVAAANCCGRVLWIQNQMLDYGFNFMNTKIYIDNESTIYETVIQEWEDRMERVATTASSLEVEHDSGNINRTESMTTLNESFPQGTDSGSGPRCQDTILGVKEAQTRFEAASKQSNDLPLLRVNTLGSGEDNMKLTKLMDLYTQLQSRFLALESTKSNQALEIESLKRRVKSLEKIRKLRTPGFKRLRKDVSASRVESSNDVSLGAQEDASKQGRKIIDLDADAEVTLVDETQEMNDPVTTAGKVVTIANIEVTTANAPTTTIDELTL
ncbi:putative ribonuclease H-like domain-containing protein, partial [Tanacetum coccineum]